MGASMMNESVTERVLRALRERVAAVSPDELRSVKPGCFQAWRSGRKRPFWLTAEIHNSGLPREEIAEALDSHVDSLTEAEAGNVYPSWPGVCKLAAALDIPLERLTFDAPDRDESALHGTILPQLQRF